MMFSHVFFYVRIICDSGAAGKYGWKIFIPKFSYTTDNAAMIAITGYFKYMDKDFCPMEAPAYSRVTLG